MTTGERKNKTTGGAAGAITQADGSPSGDQDAASPLEADLILDGDEDAPSPPPDPRGWSTPGEKILWSKPGANGWRWEKTRDFLRGYAPGWIEGEPPTVSKALRPRTGRKRASRDQMQIVGVFEDEHGQLPIWDGPLADVIRGVLGDCPETDPTMKPHRLAGKPLTKPKDRDTLKKDQGPAGAEKRASNREAEKLRGKIRRRRKRAGLPK